MASVNDIRSTFLNYFEKNGHTIVPSSSLVPNNDPTLMFTNAGMVPFKNVFTGLEKRPYSQATSSQKCVRAGGKHNDLDNVGYTARHHTFFEMLGNFSFGDYFKDRAIEFAWNLITKDYALPKDKLLVTVYADDDDAFNLWKKIAGLSDSKIIRIPTSDNFWSMGDTGPCGPCSEIFYDHGDHIWGGPPGSADQDGDRFIEIWNLVFMQFEQSADGTRVLLPKPSIDTGMGLERISAVLQGTHDNYATDMMKSLIHASAHATGIDADGEKAVSHRVIADHLRASAFLIADGVLPSNEGRGYVLRRIMRRAMRHAELLGCKEPLLYKLLPTLVKEMGHAYGELVRSQSLISETLKLEEVKFRRTLERGLSLLDEEISSLSSGDILSGEIAFKLYDTYGFPYDLTEDALRSKSIKVDKDGFDAAMTRQKNEARKAWVGSGDAQTAAHWFDLKEQYGSTEFLGYDLCEAEARLICLLKDGKIVDQLHAGEIGFALFNQTPFYAESGGQVGDFGQIHFDNGFANVTDTTNELGALFVHHITVEKGVLKTDMQTHLCVDATRRALIRANHSATHLLHEALREVLGDHVAQKGSMVSADRLRFDFSHPKPISHDEKQKIETLANAIVLQNAPVETHLMDVQAAMDSGARALFGEKYGDEVRVVSMGYKSDLKTKYSVELCGGTHVKNTGDIGLVHVTAESGVASGVRRIEAVCGELARQKLNLERSLAIESADVLNAPLQDLPHRVQELLDQNKKLERALADARKKIALMGDGNAQAGADIETIEGVKFFCKLLEGIPSGELKSIVDEGKAKIQSGVVTVISVDDTGKAAVVVGVTSDLTARFDAVQLVRKASEALGGKGGGGRADMAQAGGPNGSAAQEALTAIRQTLAG